MNILDIIIKIVLGILAIDAMIIVAGVIVFIGIMSKRFIKDKFFKK